MTLPELIAKMEAGLEGTTPGKWRVVDTDWQPWADAIEVNADNEVICFTGGSDSERQKANAAHIALCSPDNIAAIIAWCREMEKDRDRTARNRDMWKGQCERQAEQLAAFRALLRKARAALEPFGTVSEKIKESLPHAE